MLRLIILLTNCLIAGTFSIYAANREIGRTPTYQGQFASDPSRTALPLYHDLINAIDTTKGTLQYKLRRGFWSTKLDSDVIGWQILDDTMASITFSYRAGILYEATVDFSKVVLVYLRDLASAEGQQVQKKIKTIYYKQDGVPTGNSVLSESAALRKHLHFSQLPADLFVGRPFDFALRGQMYYNGNTSGDSTPPIAKGMIDRLILDTPTAADAIPVTLKGGELRFSQKVAGSESTNATILARAGSTVAFASITYEVDQNQLAAAKLQRLELILDSGMLKANHLHLNFFPNSKFVFESVTLGSDSSANQFVRAEGGTISAIVGADSNVGINNETWFNLVPGRALVLTSVSLNILEASVEAFTVRDSPFALDILDGRIDFGSIGFATIGTSVIHAKLKEARWQANTYPVIIGYVNVFQLAVTSGELHLTRESTIRLQPGSILNSTSMTLNTKDTPNIRGPFSSVVLITGPGTTLNLNGVITLEPILGTVIIANSVSPLTVERGEKAMTGRFFVNAKYETLNYQGDLVAHLTTGRADLVVVNEKESHILAEKAWFEGNLVTAKLPFGEDGSIKVAGGSMTCDLGGRLTPSEQSYLAGIIEVKPKQLITASVHFNSATHLNTTRGSILSAHFHILDSGAAHTVSSIFRSVTLKISDGSTFAIPNGISLVTRTDEGTIMAEETLTFAPGQHYPAGNYTVNSKFNVLSNSPEAKASLSSGEAIIPLRGISDDVIVGQNISIYGTLQLPTPSGKPLQVLVTLSEGSLETRPAYAPRFKATMSGTVFAASIGTLVTQYEKMTKEWFFPITVNITLLDSITIPRTAIILDGSMISTSEVSLDLTLGVNVSPGRGRYKKPDDLEKGTSNRSYVFRNKQEAWRKRTEFKHWFNCTRHAYIDPTSDPGYALKTKPLMYIVGTEVLMTFPQNSVTLTEPLPQVTFDGCAGVPAKMLRRETFKSLYTELAKSRFLSALTPQLNEASESGTIIEAVLMLSILEAFAEPGKVFIFQKP